jgi:hypothetical protein
MRGVRPRIRVGAAFQARVAPAPAPAPAPAAETTRGLVFDPRGIDPAALAAYLAAARGTEEAALARLHATGYDAAAALALPPGVAVCRDRDRARPRSAVEWRRMLARLNARRDAHDEPIAVGDAVLLRSRARLPHVGLVERVGRGRVGVRWYYWRSDLRPPVRAAANELFLSEHTDTNDVSTVVGTLGATGATGVLGVLGAPGAPGAGPFCRRTVRFPASAAQTLAP